MGAAGNISNESRILIQKALSLLTKLKKKTFLDGLFFNRFFSCENYNVKMSFIILPVIVKYFLAFGAGKNIINIVYK